MYTRIKLLYNDMQVLYTELQANSPNPHYTDGLLHLYTTCA